jgi:CYTH domain-containing protein
MADEIEYKLILTAANRAALSKHPADDIRQRYFALEHTEFSLAKGQGSTFVGGYVQHDFVLRIDNIQQQRAINLPITAEDFDEILPLFVVDPRGGWVLGKANYPMARIRETKTQRGLVPWYEITFKAKQAGIGRNERNVPLPDKLAALYQTYLFSLAEGTPIVKTRYLLPNEASDSSPALTWEVSVYHRDNAGLVDAEIEVPSLATPMPTPPAAWSYIDGTSLLEYKNVTLAREPINSRENWPHACQWTDASEKGHA